MEQSHDKIFRIFIKGKIARVWEELTKIDSPQGAVYNAMMHRTRDGAGAAFRMRSADGRHTMVLGEIIEWEPLKRFAHTFQMTMYMDPPCIVRYELIERDGGVDVTMTLERLPQGTKTAKEMMQGAKFILGNLQSLIETGKPPFKTRLMYAIFAKTGFVLPKKLRSEHWPLREPSADDIAKNER